MIDRSWLYPGDPCYSSLIPGEKRYQRRRQIQETLDQTSRDRNPSRQLLANWNEWSDDPVPQFENCTELRERTTEVRDSLRILDHLCTGAATGSSVPKTIATTNSLRHNYPSNSTLYKRVDKITPLSSDLNRRCVLSVRPINDARYKVIIILVKLHCFL